MSSGLWSTRRNWFNRSIN